MYSKGWLAYSAVRSRVCHWTHKEDCGSVPSTVSHLPILLGGKGGGRSKVGAGSLRHSSLPAGILPKVASTSSSCLLKDRALNVAIVILLGQ